jgi:hypothetical protein
MFLTKLTNDVSISNVNRENSLLEKINRYIMLIKKTITILIVKFIYIDQFCI